MSNSEDQRRISEMRNLGPACERDLNAVGIFTAEDLITLGEEAAFLKMLEGRRRKGTAHKACNAAYLYALYAAIHNIDWKDVPASKKKQFLKLTAELRESGEFRRK